MTIEMDDEILQDFLVEAGELLEQLGEQLVELEKRPQDKELLNAVFRNFHTVKGGAGFLALDALVEICHQAEDVFNILRQGERIVDARLMDVVLRAYDAVNIMITEVRSGQSPSHADAEIILALELFAKGEECAPLTSAAVSLTEVVSDVVDDEFAAMLDAAAAESDVASVDAKVTEASVPVKSKSPATGEITEDEFESLLDQLQGAPGVKPPPVVIPTAKKSVKTDTSGLITDNEFEQLLDNLQQKTVTAAPTPVTKEDKAVKSESVSLAVPPVVQSVAPTAVKLKEAPQKKPAEAAAPAGEHTTAETTVRVDTKRLDDIMNLVGELVLVRNRLATLRESMSDEVGKTVANLDLVTADLQNAVMKTRMQPIKKVFGRFPRVVRDLARTLNKQVTLELIGEETDLDKNLVEALADPLVHLVRNSVDHGIELPAVRVNAGKAENGTVILSAEQEGDHILLTINDDGAGMDPELLRRKVVEKGLMDEDAASRLDQQSCFNLIFMPGFSTKAEISDISGRGVGMDVVKTRITQLNGTINIDSELGRGTCIKIKVPLTLAIMPTLMVKLGDQVFALPLANVIEIFDSESARTSTVDGKDVVVVREKALPLVFLRKWLVKDSYTAYNPNEGYVVVVSYGSQHVGCVVDQLIGQEEVVIKPLGTMLQGTKGLSGATITGNGRIALILDMPGLMEAYGRR